MNDVTCILCDIQHCDAGLDDKAIDDLFADFDQSLLDDLLAV